MAILRRRLRAVAGAWLICQLTCLGALVPLACCAGEDSAAETAVCHRPASAKQCPMRAADGQPCPMHRDSTDAAGMPMLRGTCSAGAMAVAVLLQPAVPLATPAFDPHITATAVDVARSLRPHPVLSSPDAPPPRA